MKRPSPSQAQSLFQTPSTTTTAPGATARIPTAAPAPLHPPSAGLADPRGTAPAPGAQPTPDLPPPRTVLDAVGATPLLELRRLAAHAGLPAGTRLLAKAEHLNPGGSGKDRIAVALLDEAGARGLAPGGTVVEASSGNTGIALAQAAAARGYRLHICCSDKVSQEKLQILRALGADVHVAPNVPHDHPDHYIARAERLAESLPGAFLLGQFASPANVAVHEHETGPELLADALDQAGRLDAFVAGVGTGGTLSGVARHLRKASITTRIVLADPKGSSLAHGAPATPYLVEGIGDDVAPPLFDAGLVDEAVTIDDRTAFATALQCARLEGLLLGGSSGSHLAAAIDVARRLPPGSVVATVLPDSGRNYLSKFYDPGWCGRNGLADLHEEAAA